MKKINWFARLFMSYNQLEAHFKKNDSSDEKIARLEERVDAREKEINSIKEMNDKLSKLADESKNERASVEAKMQAIINELSISKKSNQNNLQEIAVKNSEISNLRKEIQERKSSLDKLSKDIHEKLMPLNRIEKTFFASTGNKGKGELGEMQLKMILEKSGLDSSLWTENLIVGKSSVEFAMKSGDDKGKWIPIDSKVLETHFDEDGKPIIDDSYKNKVKVQVKEVSKYLGKSNTADYGLLVLQNDDIYLKLYDDFPFFFKEMIEEYKIYISSPSSFVQMAWSISNIIKIFERINNDQKIYDEMVSVLDSINKFGTSLSKAHKDFNVAMNSHYPTIQNKQNKLIKKLDKEGKIKGLPELK
ncbi:MAG: DNA recombination protein RmuC [Mycoplasmatales bacterium]|nr:DNA recombination protein RmuC [Mycoplasmatales bacterium]